MSVYTKVEPDELFAFLQRYSIGKLIHYAGISAGVTNSNYWLETEMGQYVLTLFEHLDSTGLDYVLGLQHHLADKGVSCTAPIVDNEGLLFSPLNHKLATIVNRIPGSVCRNPSVDQCRQIGAELASFHLAGLSYNNHKSNSRGLNWWKSISQQLHDVLDDADLNLINLVIEDFELTDLADLPQGALHGDLFHDNVLFDGDCLGGIIDFDYACYDYLVYDMAVTANDWCIDSEGALLPEKMSGFIAAYDEIRLLQGCELTALPIMLEVAALRFWLSRLYDLNFPLKGELTFVKDPVEFRKMLLLRREKPISFTNTKTGKYSSK
jgi:homoserine kinase type II